VPFRLLAPPLTFAPDELYRVPTEDGSAVALGRYRPRGDALGKSVLLVHSLGTNRFNLDFDERYSVARALARRGFEAWVLELRGHGLAGSAEGSSFDVEATFDVAAALTAITSTGVRTVGWVGHSRGGLLAYAHLGRFPRAPISAVVTLGAPLKFASPGLSRFVAAVTPVLHLPTIPLRLLAKAAVPLGLPPDPFGKYFARAENLEPRVMRQAIAHVTADIPQGVARAFARWVRTGVFDGDDGFDYLGALAQCEVPMLAIAGAADWLAPPASAHALAGLTKGSIECVTVGVATGFTEDYGHGDLVLGRRAPDEVVPLVAEFLARPR
jgi:pimeloyl-ACP methyl ester carboxylesterase